VLKHLNDGFLKSLGSLNQSLCYYRAENITITIKNLLILSGFPPKKQSSKVAFDYHSQLPFPTVVCRICVYAVIYRSICVHSCSEVM